MGGSPLPEKIATGPDQIWCWDITYIPTKVKGQFFYAYMVIDIFDRYAVFSLLFSELKLRGAEMAHEIIFSADGAKWIWNRVDSLIRKLGIPPERVVKVADFYHAVEHLHCIAGYRTDWKIQGQQKKMG